MLTDDDVIADLSRLRERSAGIEYTGEIPLTRRSVAATVVPVAALAAVATLGAGAVIGSGPDGSGAGGSRANQSEATSATKTLESPKAAGAKHDAIKLVSSTITLGQKTLTYSHAVDEDPFSQANGVDVSPGGWHLLIEYGASLPQGATKFELPGGEPYWVADAPAGSAGNSVLIFNYESRDHNYYGGASKFSRQEMEDFVTTSLHGTPSQ